MRKVAGILGSILVAFSLSACATAGDPGATKTAFAPEAPAGSAASFLSPGGGSLAGRTIRVRSVADIRLGPKEVVLTFDDGPMPGKTDKILSILSAHGVKATFLMVGQMASAYPATARKVAAAGHSIGSHTQNHKNLRSLDRPAAMAQIEKGRQSIAGALGPSRSRPANFFRFPYLANTAELRRQLALHNMVVIDADIDSKDYFPSSPEQVKERTLSRLGARGSGIILFHDIHARTASMLPGFLAELRKRGYKVVHIAPGGGGGGPLVASLGTMPNGDHIMARQ